MIGKEKALTIANAALAIAKQQGADQAEAVIVGNDFSLTRFAESSIHQNLSRREGTLAVRVVFGKKIGTASTGSLTEDSIGQTVDEAVQMARFQADNPQFVSLPGPQPVPEVHGFVQATADYTPEDRGRDVAIIVDRAARDGFTASGSHTTQIEELAVVNSLGTSVYNASTSGYLRTVITTPDSYGYADYYDRDVRNISAAAIAEEAVARAALARHPGRLEPGAYETIFLPYAVADILRFPGYIAFDGQAVQEGRSFMTGKFGQKVLGENISIWDDGLDPRSLTMPFDIEGVPKQRVDIIKNGVATGVVYDSQSAQREGKLSTGHAYSHRWGRGAAPNNMIMAGGDATVEEMIASTKRGILVTRFHYTHCPDPMRVVMTGTTRDGTFLIENGKISRPVFNMRIEESVIELFSNVEVLSRETKLSRDWWDTFVPVLPALKIRNVHFSSGTEF